MASSAPRLAALLWDVDGTLAETERDGHRVAFNRAFVDFGLPWRRDDCDYGQLLRVSGGFERLMHDMTNRVDSPDGAAAASAAGVPVIVARGACFADAHIDAGMVVERPAGMQDSPDAVLRNVRGAPT